MSLTGSVKRLVLSRKTHSKDPLEREAAAEELGLLGEAGAVEQLVPLLKDDQSSVRKAAAKALKNLSHVSTVEPLIQALADDNPCGHGWQIEVVLALESLKDPRAVGALVGLLNHPDSRLRQVAAAALGEFAAPSSIDSLIATLKDAEPGVGRAAANSLAKIGEPAVPALIAALQNEPGYIQTLAAEALGIIADHRALPPLIAALRCKDSYVQIAAAEALARLHDPQIILPLVKALAESSTNALSYGVRDAAEAGLLKMGDVAVDPLIAEFNDPSSLGHVFVVRMLGKIRHPRGFESVLTALHHPSAEVRMAAAHALGGFGDERALEPLRPILSDPDVRVRKAAADALASLKWQPSSETEQSVYALALGNYDEAISHGPAAIDPLLVLLSDAEDGVRKSAAKALGRIGNSRAVEPLWAAATQEKVPHVQKAMEEAWAAMGLGPVASA